MYELFRNTAKTLGRLLIQAVDRDEETWIVCLLNMCHAWCAFDQFLKTYEARSYRPLTADASDDDDVEPTFKYISSIHPYLTAKSWESIVTRVKNMGGIGTYHYVSIDYFILWFLSGNFDFFFNEFFFVNLREFSEFLEGNSWFFRGISWIFREIYRFLWEIYEFFRNFWANFLNF